MATTFAAPKTWASGDIATAADFNLYIRDNTAWLGTDKPVCRAFRTSVQSTSTATLNPVSYDSESFDNRGLHSTSVNPTWFTIPAGMAGKYLMVGNCAFASNATGLRIVGWILNSVTHIARQGQVASANVLEQQAQCIHQLGVGDIAEFWAFQSSGGNLNVVADAAVSPNFAALAWLGT